MCDFLLAMLSWQPSKRQSASEASPIMLSSALFGSGIEKAWNLFRFVNLLSSCLPYYCVLTLFLVNPIKDYKQKLVVKLKLLMRP